MQEQCENFLKNIVVPKLNEEQRYICSEQITINEIKQILCDMPRNKTPGNDGLPIEFYIKFINLLRPMLIQCIKKCFESGEFTKSQKQATITLLEKPGKDNRVLKSW